MDYEKAYKDALERARKAVENGMVSQSFVDDIFGVDYEDERIRTRLIALVEAFGQGTYKKEMLAYLEKQKEQKPIFKKGDKVIWDDEEFNILDVNETEYNVGGYRVPFSRQNELHPIGQKPAEWSEEDRKMLDAIIKRYSFPIETDFSVFVGEDNLKDMREELGWLKSLRPQPQWKPSEEQMIELKHAISGCSVETPVLESLETDLRKLM